MNLFEKIKTQKNNINAVSSVDGKSKGKGGKYFNKKGSSLILAIVTITLVAILSVMVMTLAMNAYTASVQNKWADEDFYYCEECLEDVYGILIAETNGIFLDNYKQVLTMFTESTPDIINKSFREGIRLDLRSNEGNNTSDLFNALNKEISAKDENGNVVGEIKISYTKQDDNAVLENFYNGRYVFKDVCVVFKNTSKESKAKYFSSVTTDIVINIPNLVPALETDTKGSLDYIIVTGGNMTVSGPSNIHGNVYVGENLILDENSNVKFLSDYITICNQLKNNGKLSVTGSSASANIWCKDILIEKNGASTSVAGNLFVNDDLTISGNNCSVQLAGKYFGYGDGTSLTEYTSNKNGSSTEMNSAILVNGEGTLLDMLSIDELVISGHSFFPVDGVNKYMGAESLATIVSQSIYMVNGKYIDFEDKVVSIGGDSGKEIAFTEIKATNGKNLIDFLTDGYTLVTGGVDLTAAEIKVGGARVTESDFASGYLSDQMVTLGFYETGGEKYCSLYWNFASGDGVKENQSDMVAADYFNPSTLQVSIGSKTFDISNCTLLLEGKPLELLITTNAALGITEFKNFTLKDISDRQFIVTDAHNYSHAFDIQFGEKLSDSADVNKFVSSLNQTNPVTVVLVLLENSTDEAKNYEVYFQWNYAYNSSDKAPGDAFISACIEAGLIDGFLEKFMDGGYIQISPDASVGTIADLYEYIVDGVNGYAAKKFGSGNNSIYNSSLFAKNFVNSYKWYMTTLIPEKYDPFTALHPFDNGVGDGEKYSVFNRKSYYFLDGIKQNSKYLDFSTISRNVSAGGKAEIYSSNGKYKNLIINGDLVINGNSWLAGSSSIDPFEAGIIYVNGNVTIDFDSTFRGMIIANGTVDIKSGEFISDYAVSEACLEALKSNSNTIWWSLVSDEFFTKKTDIDVGTSSLNAVDCIKYENWTRNRDKIDS